MDAGLTEVFSMAGGIKGWQGATAAGAPEAGMAHFAAAVDLEQLVALAWGLEEGSRLFYHGVEERFASLPAGMDLFKELATAEVRHKQYLLDAYGAVTGKELDFETHRQRLGSAISGEFMEGGIPVAMGLAWAEERTAQEILDFAMALEVNAYDLYVKMGRKVENENVKKIFKTLANEEQIHLQRLAKLMDQRQ
ncbi:ferritin family protein [Thermodesulfobacteriota bacterium]